MRLIDRFSFLIDSILLHESIAHDFLLKSVNELINYKVMIYADPISFGVLADLNYPYLQQAEESDFAHDL